MPPLAATVADPLAPALHNTFVKVEPLAARSVGSVITAVVVIEHP